VETSQSILDVFVNELDAILEEIIPKNDNDELRPINLDEKLGF